MAKRPITIQWTGKKQFVGTDSGKHSIVISAHNEENHTGIKPSDLMLLSLGACSAYDVVDIIGKKRFTLEELRIEISTEQDPDPPWTYRKIHMTFHIKAQGLDQKAAQQAVDLSINKYCSVAATISGKAEISFDIHLPGQAESGQSQ